MSIIMVNDQILSKSKSAEKFTRITALFDLGPSDTYYLTQKGHIMKKCILLCLFSLNIFGKIVDLKQYQTPVKDQLDRNTCAYFAVTALIESTIKTKFNLEFDISEQFQISHGKEFYNEYPDREFGSTYDITLNFRNQSFLVLEEDAPYQGSLFAPGQACAEYDPFDQTSPKFCFSHGVIDRQNFKRIRIDGLEAEWITGLWSIGKTRSQILIEHINQSRPVVITVKVNPNNWDNYHVTYTDEDEEICNKQDIGCAGHAILLTGYDDEREVFFFKNSWGESWGKDGYGELSFEYINKFSDQPMTAMFNRILGNIRY